MIMFGEGLFVLVLLGLIILSPSEKLTLSSLFSICFL